MTNDEIIREIQKLSDKQFVEFFYQAVKGRHIYRAEVKLFDSHLVLANAVRERDMEAPWTVEVLCPTPDQRWPDDSPICQHGAHCGFSTASWAKRSRCPICDGEVYAT